MTRAFSLSIAFVVVLSTGAATAPQEGNSRRRAYDQLLEANVRDGLVYYRVLKSSRAPIDAFVASNQNTSIDSASREEQIAFWLNAYNALVLQTVINNYPIQQRTREYPARSIRQISGAFDRTPHRVAGRALTLDQIEQTVLPALSDPRVFLALGRGAVGSGRLRSEAYEGAEVERQLSDIAAECVSRKTCFSGDRDAKVVRFSSVFSWREKEFVAGYADKAPALFSSRSPVERAMIAFVAPKLLTTEHDYIDRNDFKIEFIPFDWSLNDLTGR
jgi:hypothetical protein